MLPEYEKAANFSREIGQREPANLPLIEERAATGEIDPGVAAYWRSHYDIVEYLKDNWKTPGPNLRGKIHLRLGTDDTFYLDGAALIDPVQMEKIFLGAPLSPRLCFCGQGGIGTSFLKGTDQ